MALVPFPSQTPERLPDEEPEIGRDPDDDDSDPGGKMSFLEHLDELRKRIIRSVVALFAGFLVACFFIDRLFEFIMRPLQAALPAGGTLVYTEPTEAFVLYIKIAAIAGLILASPAIMTQVWMFIAPGLYTHEKKLAIPFVALSSLGFVGGAAFSHYIVFPMAWIFFGSFTTDYMTFMPRIEPAFGLYMKLLLVFGFVFQMPTVVLFLARMGMITARFMIRNFKYAVLIIFIASAVLSPTGDAFVQTAMAGPMILLYLLSIGLAWLFGKKKTIET
ncbi:MAG: twin-arginine translocase subunit TatC [Geminicoccales bacterium]